MASRPTRWFECSLTLKIRRPHLIPPNSFTQAFGHRAAAAGVPVIRLHDLRHTHASLALRAGVHPKVVQERLGHSTVAFTLDVYSHSVPAMQEEAAALVAGQLFTPSVATEGLPSNRD